MLRSHSAWLSLILISSCTPSIESPTVEKTVTAEFDPTATPPVVPLPNDLARDPVTGLLLVPDATSASPAQLEFNKYLRTLDGFPQSTPVTAGFSDAVDPTSLTPSNAASDGAVALYDLTTMEPLLGDPMSSGAGDYTLSLSTDGKTLTITPHLSLAGAPSTQPWRLGHTYSVIVFGGGDANGLRGQDGSPVVGSPTTFFLRSAHPLLTPCAESDPNLLTAACLCPSVNGAFSSACQPATGLTRLQAEQLEPARQQTQALLAALLPLSGVGKQADNVVLTWRFTIAHGPFAVFDPSTNVLPFPNDVLISTTTDTVALPFDPNSPQAALYTQLNQLDGFSTTADVTAPIDVADDTNDAAPLGAAGSQSVFLLNTTELARQPDYAVRPELINGGKDYDGLLLIHPNRPLRPDKDEYVAVLTSDIVDGMGRALRPSPVMQMLKLESSLVDANLKSALPGLLDDTSAQQLERLRLAYSSLGLWDTLAMPPYSVPKDKIALLWTFRTQSMSATLRALAAYPASKPLGDDITILDVEPSGGALGTHVDRLVWGTLHTHLALATGGTLDLLAGTDVDVPFLMTTPMTAASPAGAPIAIVQHGLGQWRGDIRAIAEAFASQGFATIGIDINFHGARTICTANSDCAGSGSCVAGKCTTSLRVACTADSQCAAAQNGSAGTCDTTSGACSNGLALNSSLCMTHVESSQPVTECRPVASGAAFLNFQNPFAARDNFRQHVLDLAQVERVITSDAQFGLAKTLAALAQPILVDTTHTDYLGQSLGGIEGALYLSVAPQPTTGVLNVPGGRLVDLLITSPTFMNLLAPLLTTMNVTADTAAYYQLLNTLRWILDPGDPINFGRYLVQEPVGTNAPKNILLQEAGADVVIPNPVTEALAVEIGLPFLNGKPAQLSAASGATVSTFFPNASHGFIFSGEASTAAGQAQAVGWIASDGQLVLPPQ